LQKTNVRVNEIGLPIWSAGVHGDVVILTTATFGQWSLTVKSALLLADCFGVVNGSTVTTDPDYSKKIKDALQIIGNSVSFDYKNLVVEYLEKSDPKGLWEALQAVNPVNDPTVISSLRREFMTMTFDPSKEDIQAVLTRLNNIKVKLQDTEQPFTDANVRETLLQSIPTDNPLWNMAKMNGERDKKSLIETVTTLKSLEANIKFSQQTPPAIANAAQNNGEH
ncbi:hypothetical protein K3495_g16903, partial [Podosphaera aphanis]